MRKSPVRRPDQREALDGLDRRTLDRGKRKRQKGNAFERERERARARERASERARERER